LTKTTYKHFNPADAGIPTNADTYKHFNPADTYKHFNPADAKTPQMRGPMQDLGSEGL